MMEQLIQTPQRSPSPLPNRGFMSHNFDVLIVGAGFAGSVLAERFASIGKKVRILEKRPEIAGNMYDYVDDHGVLVHHYGPHLFHTNSKRVVEYLTQFTKWHPYEHKVLGYVLGKLVPIPFNLKSIELCFDDEKANQLKKSLIDNYGLNSKVTILELKKSTDPQVVELAEFVFEHVFKHYTMKQWGLTIDELDPTVTNRVPVLVSYDDRYFQDQYQQLPLEGYTKMFEKMLSHSNIEVQLNVDAKEHLSILNQEIFVDGKVFNGIVIYSGAVDELFDENLGPLPYRSEEFILEHHDNTYQAVGTVNYPTDAKEHAFTRITEYKHMMASPSQKTTIAIEYPYPYVKGAEKGNIPYYPIFTQDNQKKYQSYVDQAKKIKNLYLVGRLAEYKYYNMDAIVLRALSLFDEITQA